MNFYLNLTIVPVGADGYGIQADTNIPEPALVGKVLKDAAEAYSQGEMQTEGFEEDVMLSDESPSTVPPDYN